MSKIDTKPFIPRAVRHRISGHMPPVTGIPVLPVCAAGYRKSRCTPSQLLGALTRGPLALELCDYWHRYTSLDGSRIEYNNARFKDKVGYIIKGTIEGKYVDSEYTADLLNINLSCPVDMIVTDPDGLTVSKDLYQIPGAIYVETDLNAQ